MGFVMLQDQIFQKKDCIWNECHMEFSGDIRSRFIRLDRLKLINVINSTQHDTWLSSLKIFSLNIFLLWNRRKTHVLLGGTKEVEWATAQ